MRDLRLDGEVKIVTGNIALMGLSNPLLFTVLGIKCPI